MKTDFMPNLQRSWVAAGATAASGLFGAAKGLIQNGKANRLLNSLQYPNEQVPQDVLANQKMAQMNALTGLPSQQYQQMSQQIQQNTNNAIAQAQDRRAGIGTIGAVQGTANDAAANLGVADAQARQANLKTLYGVNNEVGQWQDKVWQNNIKDKYDRDYNYGMSLKGSANQNIDNGIDRLGSAAAMGLSAKTSSANGIPKLPTSAQAATNATTAFNNTQANNVINPNFIPRAGSLPQNPQMIIPTSRLFGGSIGYGSQPNWDQIDWTKQY